MRGTGSSRDKFDAIARRFFVLFWAVQYRAIGTFSTLFLLHRYRTIEYHRQTKRIPFSKTQSAIRRRRSSMIDGSHPSISRRCIRMLIRTSFHFTEAIHRQPLTHRIRRRMRIGTLSRRAVSQIHQLRTHLLLTSSTQYSNATIHRIMRCCRPSHLLFRSFRASAIYLWILRLSHHLFQYTN